MKKIFFLVAAFAWLVSAVGGSWWLLQYKSTPGESGDAPLQWPSGSGIQRDATQPTLVLLAHPRCPCTRATIGELALLMAQCQGKIKAQVLFFKPAGSADDWAHTDQWQSASVIPGVTVRCDEDGVEARRFHVETSGHALLYDPSGTLLFSGGITAFRGHSGDNSGRTALAALLNHQPASNRRTPVFGCALAGQKLACQATVHP